MQYYSSPSDLALPIIKQFITNPSGECRQTIYLMERKFGWGFNMASALKYLWRVGVKSVDTQSDLAKAIQYLKWELERPLHPLSFDTKTAIETAIKMCRELQQSQI
jgi:hypothetical protein